MKKFYAGLATLFILIGFLALPSIALASPASAATSTQNTSTMSWSLWHTVPGNGLTYSSLATTSYAGKDYVFARGTDQKIYVNTFNASTGTWSLWSQVPGNGKTYSALATTSYAGQLYLFARGTDNRIYVNVFNASNGHWSLWSQVPGNGATYEGLDATAYAGQLYLFAAGTDSKIYVNTFNAYVGSHGTWSLWSQVPGNGATTLRLASTSYAGQLYLFATGTDNKIYLNTFNAYIGSHGKWSLWSQVPGNGRTQSAPSVTTFNGNLYLFVRGTDNKIYDNIFNAYYGSHGKWSLWSQVPGNGSTNVGLAASNYGDKLFLYARGTDSKIYLNTLHD